MADEGTGTEGAATGPDATAQNQAAGAAQGNGSSTGQAAAASPAGGQSGAAGGVQGGTSASGSGGDAGDLNPEAMLAAAVAAGDGQNGAAADPLEAAKAETAKWKKLARQNEGLAKANADKATQFDAYQESQLTEQQKLAARAEQAEQRAATAEGLYRRTLAAATYDLPPSMIGQLGDGTEEEINARAETLAAAINERATLLAAAQQQANGQQQRPSAMRPVESLRPGALPAGDNKPADPNAWVRNMLAAKRQQPR